MNRRAWAWLAAGAVVVGAAGCGDDGGSEAGPEGEPFGVDGDFETGGIEVDAPSGWQVLPMPSLGFGLGVPESWEAVVLNEDGLRVIQNADPAVEDFAGSATAAAVAGAVFYAAGPAEAGGDAVDDLKVFADTGSGVEDVDGLQGYVEDMVAEGGVSETGDPVVLEGAAGPTVEMRFEATGTLATHGEEAEDGEDAEGAEGEDVVVHGIQRSVLLPSGLVYSFIVTSEAESTIDGLAAEVLDTVAFLPEPD